MLEFGSVCFRANAANFVDKFLTFFGLAAQSRIKNLSYFLPFFISHLFLFQLSSFKFKSQTNLKPET